MPNQDQNGFAGPCPHFNGLLGDPVRRLFADERRRVALKTDLDADCLAGERLGLRNDAFDLTLCGDCWGAVPKAFSSGTSSSGGTLTVLDAATCMDGELGSVAVLSSGA